MLNSKHIYIAFLALLLLGSCATNKDLREQQRQLRAKSVAEAVANRHFTLCIKQMYPMQGGSKVITSDFFLQLQGDTINSYLPYLGRAYSIPYGGGKGLNFIDKVRDYRSVPEQLNLLIEAGSKIDFKNKTQIKNWIASQTGIS